MPLAFNALLGKLADFGADVVLIGTDHSTDAQQAITDPTLLMMMMGKAYGLTLEMDASLEEPVREACTANNDVRYSSARKAAIELAVHGIILDHQQVSLSSKFAAADEAAMTRRAAAVARAVAHGDAFDIPVHFVDDGERQLKDVVAHLGIGPDELSKLRGLSMDEHRALHAAVGWRDDAVMTKNILALVQPVEDKALLANVGHGHLVSIQQQIDVEGYSAASFILAVTDMDLALYRAQAALFAEQLPGIMLPPVYHLATGELTTMAGEKIDDITPEVFGIKPKDTVAPPVSPPAPPAGAPPSGASPKG